MGSAAFRADDVAAATAEILEVVELATRLAAPAHGRSVREVFLMWRVAFLPGVLMPASASPEVVKRHFRQYAHALERTLDW
ncbi:hypothetical protein AB0C90_14220 [Streptomyces sp. NPDC048550]|uniref:hypothetical protein n=1 Tax=Streptomyces sp. NPDC048550 TaxID=3155739 RepID=UPI00343B0117